MTVKSSISLTDAQDAFVRRLVAEGRYSSVSAVLQQGLELLRRDSEATDALRTLLQQRQSEPSISAEEMKRYVDAMFEEELTDLEMDT
ncbi:MAG: type II toxin-antitoxin system ParD family antitoxin [Fuscovulum sp.]|nr:MAG: type II toxin-antitoxin system ParD family antitoxin [Fuscovulum sp.]